MKKIFLSIFIISIVLLTIGSINKKRPKNSDTGINHGAIVASPMLKNYTLLQSDGAAHSSWSPRNPQELIIDKIRPDNYFALYYLDIDGLLGVSITVGQSGIAQRHNGWPEWDPQGEYVVFQSEEAEHFDSDKKWLGHPGLGFYSNLWAVNPATNQFWKLTDVQYTNTNAFQPVKGVVNAMFSPDGRKLYWTERYAGGGYLNWGKWQIKEADFRRDPLVGPSLENEHIIIRAEDICSKCNYIVNMALFPNGKQMLVAGNLDGQHVYGMDQYIVDIATKKIINLTNTPKNWEEGSCLSSDGEWIVYSTDIDSKFPLDFNNANWAVQPKQKEYWIMKSDGEGKKRLTHFNEPGAREYTSFQTITAECQFSADGKKIAGIVGVNKSGNPQKAAFETGVGLFEIEY